MLPIMFSSVIFNWPDRQWDSDSRWAVNEGKIEKDMYLLETGSITHFNRKRYNTSIFESLPLPHPLRWISSSKLDTREKDKIKFKFGFLNKCSRNLWVLRCNHEFTTTALTSLVFFWRWKTAGNERQTTLMTFFWGLKGRERDNKISSKSRW